MELYDSFMIGVNAVLPFMVYMAFGYLMVRFKIIKEESLKFLNKIVFQCFFVFNMFYNFYTMDFTGFQPGIALFALGLAVLVMLALLILVPIFEKRDNRRGVIMQALVRANILIFAVPFTKELCGSGSAAPMMVSVLVAVLVPVNNIYSVLVLEKYGGKKSSKLQLLKSVFSNPLVIGSIIGAIVLALRIRLPEKVLEPIKAISDMTSPLALFIIGGTLHFKSLRRDLKSLTRVGLVRLFLLPAFALLMTFLFDSYLHFSTGDRIVIFILFAVPPAVASYPTAANMGGDAEFAGEVVATGTVASMFTLFLWVVGLKFVGVF